ncbi:MAG TPA: isopentenyl phosphate kinase [Thermoanaerobaculia bacterium]|nr:isopentenyl phosphate kinase [Thermoanaerobaculia bacterium]
MEAVLVKLGGSLITEKTRPETPRLEVIRRLASEVARAAGRVPERLIVGHGSGSFGHVAAARYGLAAGLRSPDQLPGVAETQQRAADLHRIVAAELRAAGALPFSLAPSSALVAADGAAASFAEEPLLLALGRGLLPVLWGDVVLDRGQGVAICSTERLFALLAGLLPARGIAVRRILWLGETAGVYDGSGRTIPRITASDPAAAAAVRAVIGAPAGTDVTGGMLHRVETALALAAQGITSSILDGREPGLLERALAGEEVPGTVIGI